MTNTEFQHLMRYYVARKRAPRTSLQGRRAAKGKAAGYGAVLKNTHIYSMSVETQPFQRQTV